MTSAFTPNIGLELPARNDYRNTWDVPNNANFMAIDAALGGTVNVTIGNGVTNLSKAQANNAAIVLTGNLSSTAIVLLPSGTGGVISVLNGTIGNQTVILEVQALSGQPQGAAVVLSQGVRALIVADGTNVYLADQSGTPPGAVFPYFGPSVPSGFLLAYGQNVSRATYATLFSVFGTTYGAGDGSTSFGIPDLRGMVLAGLDNMGGASANRITAIASNLGASGGTETVGLSQAGLPTNMQCTVTDPGHLHDINDPGHLHTFLSVVVQNGTSGSAYGSTVPGTAKTDSSTTGISVKSAKTGISVSLNGGGLPHPNLQPTMMINFIVKT